MEIADLNSGNNRPIRPTLVSASCVIFFTRDRWAPSSIVPSRRRRLASSSILPPSAAFAHSSHEGVFAVLKRLARARVSSWIGRPKGGKKGFFHSAEALGSVGSPKRKAKKNRSSLYAPFQSRVNGDERVVHKRSKEGRRKRALAAVSPAAKAPF